MSVPSMINLLLIAHDPQDAQSIRAALAGAVEPSYSLEWAGSLADGVDRLGRGGIDATLLDLSMPGTAEAEVFDQVALAADDIPILVLTDPSNEDVAVQAVHAGNHDYLAKSHIDGHWLVRALHYLLDDKKARDAMKQAAACFATMSDASPLGIFVSDPDGSCIYTNSAYHRISGLTFDQALGRRWSAAIHPEDRAFITTEWYEAARNCKPFRGKYRFLREDGGVVWTRVSAAAMNSGKRILGYIQTIEDITERKLVDETLFEEKERAQMTLNSIGDGIVTTDTHGDVAYLNRVAEQLTGWSSEDAIGKPFSQVLNIVDATTGRTGVSPMSTAVSENKTVELAENSVLVRPDGSESAIEDSAAPIHDREGKVTGGVMVFHDVTQSRAAAARMAHTVEHDLLTNLPNRTLFDKRMTEAMALARPHDRKVALLYMDLDQFKNVNDSLGHAIGDKLLQSVAARLIGCANDQATVCRQGGDEFAVLLPGICSTEEAVNFAEAVRTALAVPHRIGRRELRVTASIGIAIFPEHGHNVESIFHHADTAMYYAKDNGRNQVRLFDQNMNARAAERLMLESRLRRAVEEHEFVLRYQPKINLKTGAIAGTEALIRWMHPGLGLIPPGDFIPIAEACGLMVPIGRWVMDKACIQAKKWEDAGLIQSLPVAINVSAMQFRDPEFFDDLSRGMSGAGLDPHHLELELTESVLMDDVETAISALKALHAMGIRLAIDDFGTAFSSSSYLKQFAIDTLKIDHSLVHGITNDPDDAASVSAIINMARDRVQRVIAEGVETEEQLAFLCANQCHEAQGYYFSKPLSAQHYTAFLKGVVVAPAVSTHSPGTVGATVSSEERTSDQAPGQFEIPGTLQKRGSGETAAVR